MTMIEMKKHIVLIVILALAANPFAHGQVKPDTGRALEVEAGYIRQGGYASVSSGIVLGEWLYLGAGFGLRAWDQTIDDKHVSVAVPLFLQVSASYGPWKDWRLVADLKGGLVADFTSSGTGRYICPSVGVSYRRIGIKIGYDLMRMRYRQPLVSYPEGADKLKDPYYVVGYSGIERGARSLMIGFTYRFR